MIWTHYVILADLKVAILRPQPSECLIISMYHHTQLESYVSKFNSFGSINDRKEHTEPTFASCTDRKPFKFCHVNFDMCSHCLIDSEQLWMFEQQQHKKPEVLSFSLFKLLFYVYLAFISTQIFSVFWTELYMSAEADCTQLVVCLSTMPKALGSVPSTTEARHGGTCL